MMTKAIIAVVIFFVFVRVFLQVLWILAFTLLSSPGK